MRISDWSSDVCSSDLIGNVEGRVFAVHAAGVADVPDRFEAALRERKRNRAGDAGDAFSVLDPLRVSRILLRAFAGPRALGEVAVARIDVHAKRLRVLAQQRFLACAQLAGVLRGVCGRDREQRQTGRASFWDSGGRFWLL